MLSTVSERDPTAGSSADGGDIGSWQMLETTSKNHWRAISVVSYRLLMTPPFHEYATACCSQTGTAITILLEMQQATAACSET